MSRLNTCVSACIPGRLKSYRATIPHRSPMKLNRECSLQANIRWSPTTAHIVARNSANPPRQISMLPRTFQRIMYFPAAQKIWKFCATAARLNPQDANAHYLLGTLYFSRGLTDGGSL